MRSMRYMLPARCMLSPRVFCSVLFCSSQWPLTFVGMFAVRSCFLLFEIVIIVLLFMISAHHPIRYACMRLINHEPTLCNEFENVGISLHITRTHQPHTLQNGQQMHTDSGDRSASRTWASISCCVRGSGKKSKESSPTPDVSPEAISNSWLSSALPATHTECSAPHRRFQTRSMSMKLLHHGRWVFGWVGRSESELLVARGGLLFVCGPPRHFSRVRCGVACVQTRHHRAMCRDWASTISALFFKATWLRCRPSSHPHLPTVTLAWCGGGSVLCLGDSALCLGDSVRCAPMALP